jgi:hypothetical protein
VIAAPKGMTRADALRRTVELDLCRSNESAADDAGLIPGAREGLADWLKQETAAGHLHRVAINCEGDRKGTVWFCIEDKRCHVVAAAIQPGGPDGVLQALPILERAAVKLGCETISCHTARPGLINRLSQVGFGLGEVLLIKNL